MAVKSKKKKKSNKILTRFIVLMVLAVIFGVSFIWTDQINRALNLVTESQSDYSGKSVDEVKEEVAASGDEHNSLQVHFVDVGQGDACIIEFPDSTKMIIDGGKDKEKAKLLDYIDNNISDKNSTAKAKADKGYVFDYAVLTHSDEDHSGGLDDVLETYAAKVFYRPNEEATYKAYSDPAKIALKLQSGYSAKDTLAYKKVIEAGYNNSIIQYVTGASLEGNIIEPENNSDLSDDDFKKSDKYFKFEFFTPIKNSYKDVNDYSPVMILNFMQKTIVMSGDAESSAEAEFVAAAKTKEGKYKIFDESFNADVIKLGHHGSKTSSSEEYLKVLTNENLTKNVLAIVSCGTGNSYKHPHTQTLDRLSSLGFLDENILRTDINSSIVLAVAYVDGAFELLSGANVVRTEKATISIGEVVNIEWKEICITVWILVAFILIIQPILDKKRSSNKKKR